ncbi:MAG: redox-sensing transcriptional repressor Rex [Eubacterium sp.]|nr:redox-sensing transcriptional repressor Rex [Eubacterium sp.]
MEKKAISKAVIKRLPRYYRYLGGLLDAGVERISSGELSARMKVTASQIRQDLNNFGGFGQQGYGYNVRYLRNEIGKILGLDKTHNMVIIGSGHLGQALANYTGFEHNGFHIVAMFDIRKELEGTLVNGIPVYLLEDLPKIIKEKNVEIAALTLPKAKALDVANILKDNGIHAIWNFAHTDLDLVMPDDVIVQNVHLIESLMQLSFSLKTLEEPAGEAKFSGEESE